MESEFENWWNLHGIRHEAGDHKERARHAYEAGKASVTKPIEQDFWLDRLDRSTWGNQEETKS